MRRELDHPNAERRTPNCEFGVRRSAFGVRVVGLSLLCLLAGCADPAPIPPAPQVTGLDSYTAGTRAIAAGNDAQARTLLSDAVDQNPDLISARQLLGDLYWKAGDFQNAVEQYEVFARLDPYNYKTHYDVALAYQFLHRLQDAVVAYLQALKLSPRDLNSNMNLGVVYLNLGRTHDAIDKLEFAATVDPTSAAAQCNLGAAYETDNQLAKAETAYRRAMELDPDMSVAMVDLGSLLLKQNEAQEAAAVLKLAAQKSSSAPVHKKYGDALYLLQRDDEALRQYDAALRLDGRYWQAMNQVGLVRIRQYQAGSTLDENLRRIALQMWRQSLALHPDQPVVKTWIDQWNQNGRVIP
jgi:tetratricopeptide (TPR) repeat protein